MHLVQRITHRIKKNKGNALPGNIITIEIGTRQHKDDKVEGLYHETPECIAWYRTRYGVKRGNANTSGMFEVPEEFWQFLRSACEAGRTTWVLGFSLPRLLSLLDFWSVLERGWKGWIVTADPPFICRAVLPGWKGSLCFVDLRNYYSGTPKEIAESLGASLPIDPDPWDVPSTLADWAIDRAGIFHKFFLQWLNTVLEHQLGNVAETAAKQSWNSWRHSHKGVMPVVHNDEKILDLEREAYYGGRCECRVIGAAIPANNGCDGLHGQARQGNLSFDGNSVYAMDFNWHYPAVMHDRAYPTCIRCCNPGVSALQAMAETMRCIGLARCTIHTDRAWYPYRTDGITIYPTGTFVTTLCGEELSMALRSGHVTKIYESVWYESADLFSGWVARLWALRKKLVADGEKAGSRIVKLLGESLYGKFAQRAATWERAGDTPALRPFGEWWIARQDSTGFDRFRAIGWNVEKQAGQEEHRESCPIIAACITAAARVKLLNAILCAGDNHVYYYDTDSLWVDSIGRWNLRNAGWIAENTLGRLRECGSFDDVAFHGIKNYTVGSRRVTSGIPADAIMLGDGVYEWYSPARMQQKLTSNSSTDTTVRKRIMTLPHLYRHGNVGKDGWVTPRHLEV